MCPLSSIGGRPERKLPRLSLIPTAVLFAEVLNPIRPSVQIRIPHTDGVIIRIQNIGSVSAGMHPGIHYLFRISLACGNVLTLIAESSRIRRKAVRAVGSVVREQNFEFRRTYIRRIREPGVLF